MKVLAKQKINARVGVRERLIISQFVSLVTTGKITTTTTKARALKSFADKIIGMIVSKKTAHDQNIVRARLKHNKRLAEMFEKLSKLPPRMGSYVSMIGAGNRKGDNAAVSEVSLIDYDKLTKSTKENKIEDKSSKKEEKNTSGRAKKS
ncbi:hypothetical protein JW962_04020 [Candidatus Dojkabacteria bacterium]|nr:hypothetical protein [Candidatus Dojkabacteria bacterium]